MKTLIEEFIEEIKKNEVAGEMFWIQNPEEVFKKYLEKEKINEELERKKFMNDIGEGKYIK
jgi:predicted KAP-like P-loop ATPase